MSKVIMTGCDVHDDSLALRTAVDREAAKKGTARNTRAGRQALIADLKNLRVRAGADRIVFTYEASGQGFTLYDELTAAGIECYVVAPTKMESSVKGRKTKTDDRDALRLFEATRAHELAGNPLPAVWVPDRETRDDRELVRARQDLLEKRTGLKAQVQCLLKRTGVETPTGVGGRGTKKYRAWLRGLTTGPSPLGPGARAALTTLVNQLVFVETEMEDLDQLVAALSRTRRYAAAVRALCDQKGVGLTTAMVFLTELGDLGRFPGRRKLGSYLGLTPSSRESGAATDRKGHITHQGPAPVRKVLCQAVWARVRYDEATRARHARIARGLKGRRKIATVALMRQLAVWLWRLGKEAQKTPAHPGTTAAPVPPVAAGG